MNRYFQRVFSFLFWLPIYQILDAAAISYLYSDGEKNIVLLTDDRAVSHFYQYLSYGAMSDMYDENNPDKTKLYDIASNKKALSLVGNLTGYSKQILDSSTGLMSLGNGYRMYDPVTGIFMRADGQALSAIINNRYSYAAGNPVRYIDSSGHHEDDKQSEFPQQNILNITAIAMGGVELLLSAGSTSPLILFPPALGIGAGILGLAINTTNQIFNKVQGITLITSLALEGVTATKETSFLLKISQDIEKSPTGKVIMVDVDRTLLFKTRKEIITSEDISNITDDLTHLKVHDKYVIGEGEKYRVYLNKKLIRRLTTLQAESENDLDFYILSTGGWNQELIEYLSNKQGLNFRDLYSWKQNIESQVNGIRIYSKGRFLTQTKEGVTLYDDQCHQLLSVAAKENGYGILVRKWW